MSAKVHVHRTPELQREVELFAQQHGVSPSWAWTYWIRPMELRRLRNQAHAIHEEIREIRAGSGPCGGAAMTCPHCFGLRGSCCRCLETRRVAFADDLCAWIWNHPGCNCAACLAAERQRPVIREAAIA